jgi:cell division protein FtsB
VVSLGPAAKLGRAALVVVAASALALQAGIAQGATWVIDNERLLKDQLVAFQYDAPAEIRSYAQAAGMSATGELYFFTSLPKIVPVYEFDRYCSRREPGIGVLGCYTLKDGRIYLYDVTDPRLVSMEPVVAAHEMLHAAWARLGVVEQERLALLLEEGFAALPEDHELRERIKAYEDYNPASRIPELYSILGTEVLELPDDLEAHYAIYFDDRSKVVALSDESRRVFGAVQDELRALAADLESRAAEIEGLRFTYQNSNAALAADIDAFEVRRTTPGGYPTQSEFEAARAALIERQNKLRGLRELLNSKIAEYNKLLEEVTRLNTEVSELNQGINIRLREEEDELESQGDTVQGSSFGMRGVGGCCGNELPFDHETVTDGGLSAGFTHHYGQPPVHHRCDYWARPLTRV